MKISVIGTGYVGLVTGVCLAETGNEVVCMDINKEKIKQINAGILPVYEPQLEALFTQNKTQKRLAFTDSLETVVRHAQVLFLALPTPQDADGFADLQYVLQVSEQMTAYIREYKIIVTKSTVPVGTGEKIAAILSEKCPRIQTDVVSNPEFLREGVAVQDFMKPHRIVIGTNSERARSVLKTLYQPYVLQGNPIFFTDRRSSELAKYASNAFLATKISFMNELSVLCESLGANVDMLRKVMGADPRIGNSFLFAGIGYGGSCFPKDVSALIKTAQQAQCRPALLEAVADTNSRQKNFFLEKIKTHFQHDLRHKKIALWGLSFKPNTDDIREAPALYILEQLIAEGATVQAYDPKAMPHVKNKYPDLSALVLCDTMYAALKGADALILATEWLCFRNPDWQEVTQHLRQKLIFDGRNIFDAPFLRNKGYTYIDIGRL